MAHRAYQATTFLKTAIVIAGSMAAQGPVIFWTAVHRRHHSYSDREGDPHSPHLHGDGALEIVKGLWHSHMGWLFNHELTDWGTYVRDLLHDRLIFKLNRLYFLWIVLGLLLPVISGVKPIEHWHYLECRACGSFVYRERTRKLRRTT